MFSFKKRVAYHETDAMGVVHHSNYIRYFEEARVDWLREKNLIHIHAPRGPFTFAVVDVTAQYLKSARFDDEIEIFLDVTLTGLRIQFRYAIWLERLACWISTGTTGLVPLNESMRPARLPAEAVAIFRAETGEGPWPPLDRSSAILF